LREEIISSCTFIFESPEFEPMILEGTSVKRKCARRKVQWSVIFRKELWCL